MTNNEQTKNMNMKVIVINEYDQEYNEHDTIGVADSIEEANNIIACYYGNYKIVKNIDYNDHGILIKKLFIRTEDDNDKNYDVELYLSIFELNRP